ncbi:MAG: sulfatase [Armatimonadota bacterium]|jgi:N-sulfoglucosamine sulfohydrolase
MPDRPNIVMLVPHDLGTYCGCYDAAIETPNIDGLAADGVRFTRYHCSAPQCSPSRGSISTGRYPHTNGLVGLAHLGWEIAPGIPTLQQRLKRAGYSTHLFGVQHERAGGEEAAEALGYDEAFPTKGRASELAEDFSGWLGERRAGEGPFFASIGTREPHRKFPLEGPEVDAPEDVEPLPWLPDREGVRRDIGGLNALTRRLDEGVGIVREAIERSEGAENTLIVMTCDHGLAMPRAKGTCYRPGTLTTLIMRMPGRWDDGSTRDALLSNCDLAPTLMEMLGEPVDEPVDGRSFLGLLDGAAWEPHEQIFTEMTYHAMYTPMRCLRTERYAYIRNFGELPLVHLPGDIFNSPSGEEMRDEYYATARPREELYDLERDPWEYENLAGDAEYAGLLADLSDRMDRWMEETGDLLLEGRWPANPTLIEKMRERSRDESYREWFEYAWPEQRWFLE